MRICPSERSSAWRANSSIAAAGKRPGKSFVPMRSVIGGPDPPALSSSGVLPPPQPAAASAATVIAAIHFLELHMMPSPLFRQVGMKVRTTPVAIIGAGTEPAAQGTVASTVRKVQRACHTPGVVGTTSARRPVTPTRLVVPALALAMGVASLSVVQTASTVLVTSYASSSRAAAVIDLTAGLALLAAGTVTYDRRPHNPVGPLAALTGVAWLASDWVSWDAGPSLARSVAMVAAPFLLALVVHLGLAFPSGRVAGRVARALVVAAYAAAAVWAGGQAVAGDPFLDRHCWRNCTDNAFLVHADQHLVDTLRRGWLWSSIVVGVAFAGLTIWQLVRSSAAARAARRWVAVPAVVVAGTEVAYAGLLLRTPAESPGDPAFATTFVVRALALTGLALGLFATLIRSERQSRAVARLAVALGEAPAPGSLQEALRRSLGDDRLEVAYWLPSVEHHVDGGGRPVVPRPDPDQTSAAIVRDDRLVAVVIHDRSLDAARDPMAEIGAAARMAVDNERLRAEGLAHMAALRESRARVVTTADTTRRRLERDLHDGAQQRLLAVSYELRLAQAAALAEADAATAATLASASDDAKRALAELRELAHGIFPAVLGEVGLGAALSTLADGAPLPVEVVATVEGRFRPSVESAAYAVVSTAVDEAARAGATHAEVSLSVDDGRLVVEVSPAGDGCARRLGDRVGALGGSLHVDRHRVRAEIPCA
jgi:signal transduction histidine kinase